MVRETGSPRDVDRRRSGLGDSLLSGVFVKRNILESESYMAQNRLENESLIITKIAKQ